MKIVWISLLLCFLTSCASLNVNNPGVGRVKKYTFAHKDVPESFNGYRIAFISDLHYPSLFNKKRLNQLVRTIEKKHPQVLLMGGDYCEGCRHVSELLEGLSRITTEHGTVAVLGNHDYADCYEEIVSGMKRNCIRLLEHQVDTLRRGEEQILVAGVRNPFDLDANGKSPALGLSDDDFVILLVHTPDYAEEVSVEHADLALAGHTHGGQVTLFGLYAPALKSDYGSRFRTGMKQNSEGAPILVTNGLGTSRRNVRMFAPSEVVLITLKSIP